MRARDLVPILVLAVLGCRAGAPAHAAPAAADDGGLALLRAGERAAVKKRVAEEWPRYEIDQAIDDVTGTFAARLVLDLPNTTGAPLDTVPLLLHPNAAADLGAAEPGAAAITVTGVESLAGPKASFTVVRPTLVEVKLATPLGAGDRVRLAVRYEGRLRQLGTRANDVFAQAMASLGGLAGAGVADYGLLGVGDGLLTFASAYPMLAPWRDGAFDIGRPGRVGDLAYNGMASFRVRTVLPDGVQVVTNLVDAPAKAAPGGGLLFVSEGAAVRDFVLVAGRDLERASVEVGGTRVTSVYRAKDARAGKVALDAAAAALASFEKRFGAYPWAELDVVEASLVGGAGGVEFSSLVLMAGMLYRDPGESTSPLAMLMKMWGGLGDLLGGLDGAAPPAQQVADTLDTALEFTVAHEVAHQWFAGIVGNDSHRFPSVDEPLAQYAAGLAIADRHGRDAGRSAMDMNVKLNYALYRVLGGPDRPALRDTASYRTPIEYAGLVYGKAPYLYVELAGKLGEEKLHRAIRKAVEKHRFGIVGTPEWIATLEKAAGGKGSGVAAAARRWLEEAHGDQDLHVDEEGDFVLEAVFPPEVVANLRQSLPIVGMKPRDLLLMIFGGGLSDDAPLGPGVDVDTALKALQAL